MASDETPQPAQRIVNRPIEIEMRKSYIDYAMSVIVGRALPDVRDGLKPAHRRILFGMNELGANSNRAYKKCARVVGDVLGKFHPHGDQAVYDTLVRMAQPFSMRYTLVDGQGNFGSVDGDAAAAMRYTECRLSRIAEEMLQDLDKETVVMNDNFDATLKEPEVLPSKFPNLLANGSNGIAVGMATNMPPHNLNEIVDGLTYLIENPDADMAQLMERIRGPDFPTGGIVYGLKGLVEAYSTGRGKITVRARTEVEEEGGKRRIVVTEIPYQVNKSALLEDIARLVKEKKIEGITDLRDESDREGMRIVIELRRDSMEDIVLNQLYTHSQMEVTFGIINIALVDNQPRVLSLKELMRSFIDFRRNIIRKRAEHDLAQAKKRMHIVEGLMIAVDNVDRMIELIRSSTSGEEAKEKLVAVDDWGKLPSILRPAEAGQPPFTLSEEQAKAILDMRLQKLTGLEMEGVHSEYTQLLATIEEGEQKCPDVGTVNVRICHEYYLVVSCLAYVELITYARPYRGYQSADALVLEYLVKPGLFDVQYLAPEGKNCLSRSVPPLLRASACGISFHDEQLALGRITLAAVGKLSWKASSFKKPLAPCQLPCLPGRLPCL